MPQFTRGAVTIRYTERGRPDGFPVLTLAPGGMRSTYGCWARSPWNPLERLTDYRVIGMDQRNAGQSRAPISAFDGWHSYRDDQLALLDHLGVDRFHAVGMCIGGPFIMGLAQAAPERLQAAVMMQPIGLDANRQAFFDLFDSWAGGIGARHPEAGMPAWRAFRHGMFGGEFMFNTTLEDIGDCDTPFLVLMGDDRYHPESISRSFAAHAPHAILVERWKDTDVLEQTDARIQAFLATYTPLS